VTRILDFRLTSSWRSPSVRAVTACFVAQYMPCGWMGGRWPITLEAGNGHVPLSTDVPNHKTAYCTLLRINTANNSSNITFIPNCCTLHTIQMLWQHDSANM
jgi:hypothetical protein